MCIIEGRYDRIDPMSENTGLAKSQSGGVEKRKRRKLNPKQRNTIENWINPKSETYGNLYKSAVKAGFRRSYALNLTSVKPEWLYETVDSIQLDPEHITQGVQALSMAAPDSRSPDDTRLKAYELLAKLKGMVDNKGQTTNVIVQPILGGASGKASGTASGGASVDTPKKVDIDTTPDVK